MCVMCRVPDFSDIPAPPEIPPKQEELLKVIEILETEKTCVERASNNQCNRACKYCDLVRPSEEILESYEKAISIVRKEIRGKS